MTDDDHALATGLAEAAGKHLLALRAEPDAPAGAELGERGDGGAHELLVMALSQHRPADSVLSEHGIAGPPRRPGGRTWIVDPLDGTREFGEPGRRDWAVHVALAERHHLVCGAVALPAEGIVLSTAEPVAGERRHQEFRIAVSRSRPPAFMTELAAALAAETVPMGSAGVKITSVVRGEVDAYVHTGGQYEWDSAAPVAVARSVGLHTSRVDGSDLVYDREDSWLPDLLVCHPEDAERLLTEFARLGLGQGS
ncbi:3'(2'),5'-bisphosphate nucleotidase CysQ [Parasphingorhabdus pacifica]